MKKGRYLIWQRSANSDEFKPIDGYIVKNGDLWFGIDYSSRGENVARWIVTDLKSGLKYRGFQKRSLAEEAALSDVVLQVIRNLKDHDDRSRKYWEEQYKATEEAYFILSKNDVELQKTYNLIYNS